MVLVAANHVVLFGFSWLVMGLIMSGLIGCVDGWSQAREAAKLSRRYFVVSSLFVGTALGVMWWKTGSSTVSGILDSLGTVPQPFVLISIGALVLAAMVQSARSMLGVLVLGGVSAVLGKLMKSVQSDIKRKLGCSTVGQMGFMILQAGLGFFNAAITHLILHGFYKAYLFLSSGERVSHESPDERDGRSVGVLGALTTLLTAVAGGALFALLTGKGTGFDSGLLLTLLVVVTTFHGSRNAVRYRSVPSPVRFGAVPVLFLVSISVYALIFRGVSLVLSDVPVIEAPTEVTPVHAVVAVAFVVGYVAVEFDVQRRSKRLYTGLLNLSSPSPKTVLTDKEDYDAR
ncbi:MAG: proton-conducting transporter membrane subunit, partial [Halobacteria archaeon]|nr:proton-conducting transporter membrane subunit [Halobacteria archaeon]